MGLISLVSDVVGGGFNAIGGTINSTIWKEYFESGDMSDGVLMKRADKILTGSGKNRRADDNLISSGSGIDVQESQCMIIVENGKVIEFCAEPGRYTYDSSIQPSLYAGNNKGLKALGKEILNQWSAGGQRFSTQRVYFINLGELIYTPIKWGSGDIAFHHTQVYKATGACLELDMTLKANGQVTIRITDPTKFFKTIGAQKTGTDGDGLISVTDEGILSNLKSGMVDYISSAISMLGTEQQVSYTAIKAKTTDIRNYINTMIDAEWAGTRGFGIANFTINGSPIPSDENKQQLEEMQTSFNMSQSANAMNYDIQKTMARGVQAAGENGGANGLFGVGMGMGAIGGNNFGNIQNQGEQATPTPSQVAFAATGTTPTWVCACGAQNDGAFCKMCGSKKPDKNGAQEKAKQTWSCVCGKENGLDSQFCSSCGAKKPTVKKLVCDKCGWTPTNPNEEIKFCPKCGDIFNDADIVEE